MNSLINKRINNMYIKHINITCLTYYEYIIRKQKKVKFEYKINIKTLKLKN